MYEKPEPIVSGGGPQESRPGGKHAITHAAAAPVSFSYGGGRPIKLLLLVTVPLVVAPGGAPRFCNTSPTPVAGLVCSAACCSSVSIWFVACEGGGLEKGADGGEPHSTVEDWPVSISTVSFWAESATVPFVTSTSVLRTRGSLQLPPRRRGFSDFSGCSFSTVMVRVVPLTLIVAEGVRIV